MSKRILLFSNWFPPVISGSSYYTSSLAQALAARGHEVAVVTLDWGVRYAPAAIFPFPIYVLPAVRIPKLPVFFNLKLMAVGYTPGNRRRLGELIARHGAQVLHHVNHIFDTTALTARAARDAGIPVVGSITTPIQHQNPWMQRLMSLADRQTLGRFGVRRWDGIVSLDRGVHQYVGDLYGAEAQRRSAVIPFGVRQESLASYGARPEYRSTRPQILTVGHIHPFRNPVQLVRAMPLVLERFPNARLVLAGRVELKEPVEAARSLGLTDEQVHFTGQTDHHDTVRLMQSSHVFASWVTGPYHALGTAPMEAMLCETPVINDLPEDLFGEGKLRDGENIVLVDSRDPRSIAGAIIRLLGDEELRRKVGAGGRRFVLEHLSWDGIAAEMERFYDRVIERHGGRMAAPSRGKVAAH